MSERQEPDHPVDGRQADHVEAAPGDRSAPVEIARRFVAINGLDHGGLLALEFFTTMTPLMILAFSWARDFRATANVGTMLIRQLHLRGENAEAVRSAFGSASDVRSVWSAIGVLGFLAWGIPMAMTVARMFAKAWAVGEYPVWGRLWRGAVWFVLNLLAMIAAARMFAGHVGGWWFRLLGVVPSFVLWGASPLLLLPPDDPALGGRRRSRQVFLIAGLSGAVIDMVLRFASWLVFPRLLEGWRGFGPIGVAMTLMTWSGVLGVAWVVSACTGAVLYERHALRSHQPLR